MLEWYKDKKLGIFFSSAPCVKMRYPLPSMTTLEKRAISKYPFENKKLLNVKLCDYKKKKEYEFSIRENYCWDGASIPRLFWREIGAKTDPKFLIPSLIHDVLCENHDYIDNDRYFSSCVFDSLLKVSKVNPMKRGLMKHTVDFYQRFCGWNNDEDKKE